MTSIEKYDYKYDIYSDRAHQKQNRNKRSKSLPKLVKCSSKKSGKDFPDVSLSDTEIDDYYLQLKKQGFSDNEIDIKIENEVKKRAVRELK